jgi:hypothetical protein
VPERDQLSEEWKNAKDTLIDSAHEVLLAGANPAERPSELFHFTDMAGLLGILSTRTLWASQATSLNDRSEVEYGIALAVDILEDSSFLIAGNADLRAAHRAKFGIEVDDKVFCKAVKEFFIPEKSPSAIRVAVRPYIISLCARSDQAIHWLHYGRSGSGAAIGLNSQAIQREPFDLFPVIYDPGEQKKLVRRVIEIVFNTALRLTPSVPEDDRLTLWQVAAHMIPNYVRLLSPRLKSPAFAAEGEWRLISYSLKGERVRAPEKDLPTRFRIVAGRIVPYLEHTFEELPVTQLILGASSMQANDPGLVTLIGETLGREIPVSVSSVPVRP